VARTRAHPDLLAAVRRAIYRKAGGHQAEVQTDLALLSTTTLRCLLAILRKADQDESRARRPGWMQ